jgi:hypothetical protein
MRVEFPNCRVADTRSTSRRVRTPRGAYSDGYLAARRRPSAKLSLQPGKHAIAQQQPALRVQVALRLQRTGEEDALILVISRHPTLDHLV